MPSLVVLGLVDHLVPDVIGAHVDRVHRLIGVGIFSDIGLRVSVGLVVGDDRLLGVPCRVRERACEIVREIRTFTTDG